MHPTTTLLTLALVLHTAHAWGTLGHETIAYIAQHYVSNHTTHWAQTTLIDTSSSYLASVATWADSYRYTAEGEYAIANYTTRVQTAKLGKQQVDYALRFFVHFIGDITQPLHNEALELGGNDIAVTFDGTATNLHHIRDTNMPEELRGGYSMADAAACAANLTAEINSGLYEREKVSWISILGITDAKATAMNWATGANAFVRSIVLPGGEAAINGTETYPEYYDSAIGTAELQIAKAGYRLAAWLDAIAAAGSSTKVSAYGSRQRGLGVRGMVDMSAGELLPAPREVRAAMFRRAAVGLGGAHEH
ncbi:hypothetical protein B0A55_11045 [Friedmanniomyces simplex]|uniref:Nuclease S1 n=1 Tax=Friedmanniomyces simplex TaxID=329884 RepID=A0A4U0WEJ8_9PEZI|nr:hypothetical protein B0A55_11045 [Friedmanniomyces simplex]